MTKAVKQVGILGVGSYLPSKILTNHDLEKMVDTSDEWIVQRTGIRTRHIAAPEQATSDMALIAARRALEDAGVAPADLDLIIVATATPDYGLLQPLRLITAYILPPPALCRTDCGQLTQLRLTFPQAALALFTV